VLTVEWKGSARNWIKGEGTLQWSFSKIIDAWTARKIGKQNSGK